MTIERKVGMGIAGQPSGGATDVADVFSTTLYTGNANTNRIVTGINLVDNDGLIWIKNRTSTTNSDHLLMDTVQTPISGSLATLKSNATTAAAYYDGSIGVHIEDGTFGIQTDGFQHGSTNWLNTNNIDYASWTFRKKEKFFDIVTWTGNGVAGREIAHGLGGAVGMIVVKRTSGTTGWATWHRSANSGNAYLELNETDAQNTNGKYYWGNNTNYIAPTSTEFTVATDSALNANGQTYVAYLFADNSSEDADDQMIKCGSIAITSGTQGVNTVNLGWEPQFVLIKRSTYSEDWIIVDSMRGLASPPATGSNSQALHPNLSSAENASSQGIGASALYTITPTGFTIGNDLVNTGHTYIYMAIRAPMMVEPEAATDVFEVDQAPNSNNPRYVAPFPIDMGMARRLTGDAGLTISSRKTMGQYIRIDNSASEVADSRVKMDFSNGWDTDGDTSTAYYSWMWKRAKGFFDVVAYTGTGSNMTVPHSLGAVPEMIWVKRRNGSNGWFVYTAEGAGSSYLHLQDNYNYSTNATGFNNTAATSSVFSVGTNHSTNRVSGLYIAYLFATLDGVSKCGTYTGNGSSQTINCGFSAGARFVLIKRANLAVSGNEGDWFMWDSLNGIVAGNDPHLSINTGTAQVTSDDSVDPANAGFIVNQVAATNINVSSSTYIFYAIA